MNPPKTYSFVTQAGDTFYVRGTHIRQSATHYMVHLRRMIITEGDCMLEKDNLEKIVAVVPKSLIFAVTVAKPKEIDSCIK